MEFEFSDPERIPGSHEFQVIGVETNAALARKKVDHASMFRLLQLNTDPSLVKGNYDLEQLVSIHKYIFQDVYDWAGKLRSFDSRKDRTCFTPSDQLLQYKGEAFKYVRDFLNISSLHDAPEYLARALGLVNLYHPFPDGNGRAQRLLISIIAAEKGIEVNWHKVDKNQMMESCAYAAEGRYGLLEDLMKTACKIPSPTLKISKSIEDFRNKSKSDVSLSSPEIKQP